MEEAARADAALRDGETYPYIAAALRVQPYRLAWQKTPNFASTSTERPVRNERRTPGSVRHVETYSGKTRVRRRVPTLPTPRAPGGRAAE